MSRDAAARLGRSAERRPAGGDPFGHQALLYGDEASFLRPAAAFVREGVRLGDHVVVALGAERAEALRAAVGGDADAVAFVTVAEWYRAPGRQLAALHRYPVLHPGRTVRVLGEQDWSGCRPVDTREWFRLESVSNDALSGDPLRLMCAFDVRALGPRMRARARRTHPWLVADGVLRRSDDYVQPAAYSAPDVHLPLPPPTGEVHRLDIDGDLGRVRTWAASVGAGLGLPADRLEDLVVAVNEMAANVIEHGSGEGAVLLWRGPDRVLCDVTDRLGKLDDPLIGYAPTHALSVRGYGLWITRQICDLVEVRTTGTGSVVRLHVKDG
ncbi:sensor histidine kinase [Allonocardiopsis opalescens]|nr:sensor histidine kinase [Allonocardiopsis opalescens]